MKTATPFSFHGSLKAIPVSKLQLFPSRSSRNSGCAEGSSSIASSTPSTSSEEVTTVSILEGSTQVISDRPQVIATPSICEKSHKKFHKNSRTPRESTLDSGSYEDTKSFSRGQKTSKFPKKLFDIVNSCANEAIQWSEPFGTSILVNYETLQSNYLGSVFKTANVTSFVRQLNLYRFRKVNNVQKMGESFCTMIFHEFQHPYFIRGRPDLLSFISRIPTAPISRGKENRKKTNSRKSTFSESRVAGSNLLDRMQQASMDELKTAMDYLTKLLPQEDTMEEVVMDAMHLENTLEMRDDTGDQVSLTVQSEMVPHSYIVVNADGQSNVIFISGTEINSDEEIEVD